VQGPRGPFTTRPALLRDVDPETISFKSDEQHLRDGTRPVAHRQANRFRDEKVKSSLRAISPPLDSGQHSCEGQFRRLSLRARWSRADSKVETFAGRCVLEVHSWRWQGPFRFTSGQGKVPAPVTCTELLLRAAEAARACSR